MDFIFVMWMALHPRKSVIQYGVGSWLAAQLTLCAFPVLRTSGILQISHLRDHQSTRKSSEVSPPNRLQLTTIGSRSPLTVAGQRWIYTIFTYSYDHIIGPWTISCPASYVLILWRSGSNDRAYIWPLLLPHFCLPTLQSARPSSRPHLTEIVPWV